jgi:hypothetical protein
MHEDPRRRRLIPRLRSTLPLALTLGIVSCGAADELGAELAAASGGRMAGHIDGIGTVGGQAHVQGWACLERDARAVSVHLYLGGPYGTGQFVLGARADKASEPGVSRACGTTGAPHRFSLPIERLRAGHAGQTIWIHAIHPAGRGPNPTIARSGVYAVPSAPSRPAPPPSPGPTIAISGPSGGDDRPTIQRAIDEAIARGNTEVVLGPGTYRLDSGDGSSNAHLVFRGGNNVALRARASGSVKLLMGQLSKHGIAVHRTKDITLENLVIDWRDHPFGQGTIHSIDRANRTIWVTNDGGYLPWNHGHFSETGAGIYLSRAARGATPPACLFLHGNEAAWGHMNGFNWFRYRDTAECQAGFAPGHKVVLVKNSWTSTGLHLVRVKGAMVRNVTLHAAPGLAVLNELSDKGSIYPQINFSGLRITYHPTDTSRSITTNADGIHSTGSRAALLINNSHFEGMMDDGLNLHVRTGRFIGRWQSGQQWIIAIDPVGGWGDWRIGDSLDIYDPKTPARHCSVVMQSEPYTAHCGGKTCINVSPPMYGSSCTGMISYDGSNPETADLVANQNLTMDWPANQPSVIEHNTFLDHRGRALLNRMWNTIVRHNTFGTSARHSSWAGIFEGWGTGAGGWGEGTLVTLYENPTQQIYGNGGYFGNNVAGCMSACP